MRVNIGNQCSINDQSIISHVLSRFMKSKVIMVKANVGTLSLVIVLKVLSCDGFVENKFSCSSICDGINSGYSGLCCGINKYQRKKTDLEILSRKPIL